MSKDCIWVAMDVHKKNIAVAVVRGGRQTKPEEWEVANDQKGVRRLIKKLKGMGGEVRCCYEAGPCGFTLQRQLRKAGLECAVIAPSLVPMKCGERVKTDRRDAKKLVMLWRADLLTEIHPPTEAQECLRDLTRCREDAKDDQKRAKQRLQKFLLRWGRNFKGKSAWTQAYCRWLRAQRFDNPDGQRVLDEYIFAVEEATQRLDRLDRQIEEVAQQEPYKGAVGWLRCVRGIDTVSAMGYVTELYCIERFDTARGLMAFVGQVPSEHSSGSTVRRGGITKTGNGHVRRLLTENAQHVKHRPNISANLRKRRAGQPAWVIAIADKAQQRLYRRYWHLIRNGKHHNKAITAVGRELIGFVWAILIEGRRRQAECSADEAGK